MNAIRGLITAAVMVACPAGALAQDTPPDPKPVAAPGDPEPKSKPAPAGTTEPEESPASEASAKTRVGNLIR